MAEYKDEKEYTELPHPDICTTLDKEPVEVTNPYTEVKFTLTPTEVAVFDYLMGANKLGLMEEFFKGKDWFIKNNPEAYYALID
jgi:hypothetical protein